MLSFFITNEWDSDSYWWIFGFLSLIPALSEAALIFLIFSVKIEQY